MAQVTQRFDSLAPGDIFSPKNNYIRYLKIQPASKINCVRLSDFSPWAFYDDDEVIVDKSLNGITSKNQILSFIRTCPVYDCNSIIRAAQERLKIGGYHLMPKELYLLSHGKVVHAIKLYKQRTNLSLVEAVKTIKQSPLYKGSK